MAEAPKKTVAEAEELPKTIVRRVVKDKLSRCSEDGDITIHKDALLACSESARIFIHYLSATANDICKESKRQIISAEDVFRALEETEFSEFIRPLKASLEEFKKKNAGKKAVASKGKENDTNKKINVDENKKSKVEGVSKKKKVEGENKKKKVEGENKKRKVEVESSDKGEGSDSGSQ